MACFRKYKPFPPVLNRNAFSVQYAHINPAYFFSICPLVCQSFQSCEGFLFFCFYKWQKKKKKSLKQPNEENKLSHWSLPSTVRVTDLPACFFSVQLLAHQAAYSTYFLSWRGIFHAQEGKKKQNQQTTTNKKKPLDSAHQSLILEGLN